MLLVALFLELKSESISRERIIRVLSNELFQHFPACFHRVNRCVYCLVRLRVLEADRRFSAASPSHRIGLAAAVKNGRTSRKKRIAGTCANAPETLVTGVLEEQQAET